MDRGVLVTGAAHAIGAEIAARFAAAGDRVALFDRDPVVADVSAALGDACLPVVVDLTDVVETRRAVSSAIARLGGLDVLVNNAGIFRRADIACRTPTSGICCSPSTCAR